MEHVIKVDSLIKKYDRSFSLGPVNIAFPKGFSTALIGANGAGKTTTLNSISNIIKKQSGSIFFNGNDITAVHPDKIVRQNLIQVPEGRRIFANLTVLENLELGAYLRKDKDGIKRDMERVFGFFPRLKERIRQNAGTLSGGEQQMLAMGRALMAQPKLLLLDEPSMGLAPILVDEIFEIIRRINADGTTILLVEQNAFKALSIADRAYVLETGTVTKSGKASDLIADDSVKSAYLGG